MALCFALSGILCLFFKELFFLAYVLDYIPLLGEISLFTFFLSLCCVTCFPSKFAKVITNIKDFIETYEFIIISCSFMFKNNIMSLSLHMVIRRLRPRIK